jgi:hypothetical protein
MNAQKLPESNWVVVRQMQDRSRRQILAGKPLQQSRRGEASAEECQGDVQVQTFKTKEQSRVFDERTLVGQFIIVADCESENTMRGGGGRGVNGLATTRKDIVPPGSKQQNLRGIVRQGFGIAKPGDCFNPAQGLFVERRCRGILLGDEISEDALVLHHKAATSAGAFPLEDAGVKERLVANAIQQIAPEGDVAVRIQIATVLAALVGIIQLTLGLGRLGVLANFLSHPVLTGFTSAAAILIALSQFKHLLGLRMPHAEHLHELVLGIGGRLAETNAWTLVLGVLSLAGLFAVQKLGRMLKSRGKRGGFAQLVSKSGPLLVVILCSLLVWGLSLASTESVTVVGKVPQGLPGFSAPAWDFELWRSLLPHAVSAFWRASRSADRSLLAGERRWMPARNFWRWGAPTWQPLSLTDIPWPEGSAARS